MKVTTKPNATDREKRLVGQAARAAQFYRHLTPGSPLRKRTLDRYNRIVAELGYDPIS
ncbi:hypothetical protein AB0B27_13915 [Micromonospora rifamycinica]|uniref:hypothetical protein n=1 Tax=Micromonospora rifamycinica TaxID=291594 RepID=UPI00340A2353